MPVATLSKWGNSQGILIPKSVCEALGLSVGDKMELRMDAPSLVLTPQRKYCRSRKVTIDELFEGWEGDYEPPSDWPTRASEVDWGEPRGKELW